MSTDPFLFKRSDSDKNPVVNKNAAPLEYKKPQKELLTKQQEPLKTKKSFTQSVYEQMKESEDLERENERHQARSLSRIGEAIAGVPGDLFDFIVNTTGLKPINEFPLPTSNKLQEFSEKATLGYTKPQNEFEEKTDRFVKDVAMSMLPGGGSYGFIKNLAIPLAGNLVQEGLGKDEKKATAGKLATMIALDLLNSRQGLGMGGTKNYIGALFRKSEQSIPKGQLANAVNLENSLTNLYVNLHKGGQAASKTKAFSKIEEIVDRIKGGRIEAAELPEFRKTINEAITELGGWNFDLPKPIKKLAIKNLNKVKDEIINAGKEHGITNPEFLKFWTAANEASSAYQSSQVIAHGVEKLFGNKFKSKTAKLLFGLGVPAAGAKLSPLSLGATGAVSAAASALYQGYKVLHQVVKSPALAKYYGAVIKQGLGDSAPRFVRSIKELDEALLKEEKKKKAKIDKLLRD